MKRHVRFKKVSSIELNMTWAGPVEAKVELVSGRTVTFEIDEDQVLCIINAARNFVRRRRAWAENAAALLKQEVV